MRVPSAAAARLPHVRQLRSPILHASRATATASTSASAAAAAARWAGGWRRHPLFRAADSLSSIRAAGDVHHVKYNCGHGTLSTRQRRSFNVTYRGFGPPARAGQK